MKPGAQAARRASRLATGLSDSTLGVCAGISGDLAIVNIGGANQAMPWVGGMPYVGDTVRVIVTAQKVYCFSQYGAPLGTVVSVASSVATVTGDDGDTYKYPFSNGLTLSAGHRVALDHALRVVVLRLSAEPPGTTFKSPAGPPSGGAVSATFHPTDSGNYVSGAFKTQFVDVSSSHSAYYWYGTQMRDTIPAGATITKAVVRLAEVYDELPGVASILKLHADPSTAHGGEPSLLGSGINVSDGGEIALLGYAALLQAGTAFGLGFGSGHGWRRFDTYLASGDIYMEWA